MTVKAGAAGEWRRFWTLPIAAALGYSVAVLHSYSLGSFIAPLQSEFGWSRAQTALGLTIAGLTGAVLSVPVGALVDRLGSRRVGISGVVLMTASCALLGTATGTQTNWILLWSFVAFANLWLQATVWTRAVATRFVASRGLAFAITLSGASLSATAMPLLANALIGLWGWRIAFPAMSAIWLVATLPIMLLYFHAGDDGGKHPRDPIDATDTPPADPLPGLSVAEGLRLPAYYKLLLACGLFTFTNLGIVVHFVPILTDRGTDALAAAGIAALIGVFSVVGRLGTGFLLDRLPSQAVGAAIFLLPVLACGLLLVQGDHPGSQSLSAALFGLTVGAEVDVIAFLAAGHFGLRHYGKLFGGMVGALSVGLALGPLAAGAAYDRFGSYSSFLLLTIACMLISSLALATLGRPRFGAH